VSKSPRIIRITTSVKPVEILTALTEDPQDMFFPWQQINCERNEITNMTKVFPVFAEKESGVADQFVAKLWK